jgi:hypothetical protein
VHTQCLRVTVLAKELDEVLFFQICHHTFILQTKLILQVLCLLALPSAVGLVHCMWKVHPLFRSTA